MSDNDRERFVLRSIRLIDSQIRNSTNLAQKKVLYAKKAAGLARHSYLEEAKLLIAELRRGNEAYDPQLSAWILFAEGQIEHWEGLNNRQARDKFVRSLLISQVAKDRELASTSATWLAHCDFVDGRLTESATHLTQAFEWQGALTGEAKTRACMVLADGFSLAGEATTARKWYAAARASAVADGDLAMQNAVLFNSAAFHVAALTLDDCLAHVDPLELKRAKMEIASARNLNTAIGINSLPLMIPLMEAELLVIEREWLRGNVEFCRIAPEMISQNHSKQMPRLLAQRSWVRANADDPNGALDDAKAACNFPAEVQDIDDLAVIHFRLAGVGRLLSNPDLEDRHTRVAAGYLQRFREQQSEAKKLFSQTAEKALK